MLLVAVALLPAIVLSVTGLFLLTRQQEREVQRAAIEHMRALSSAVDNELNRTVASLEVLASSQSLRRGDLKAFAIDAEAVLALRNGWETIVLRDPAGETRFNLRAPPGVPPQVPARSELRVVDRASFDTAVAQRRPVVGRVLPGRLGRYLFPVHYPVVVDGEVRNVLTAVVKPDVMLELIRRQKISESGVVSVIDGAGNQAARSRSPEKFVGQPVSAGLQALMRAGNEGAGPIATLEGQPIYAAYSRSESTGWSVAVGIPREDVMGPVQRSYSILVGGILLSLGLGAFLSTLVARRITGPMAELRAAAIAVGKGEKPGPVPTTLPEIRDVSDALQMAAELRRVAETAREELLETERHARATAEDSNRLKDEFLAMLGHELRNPVAAISTAYQLLKSRGSTDENTQRALAVLGRQTGQLTRLLDDLLDVGRVTAGKIQLELRRVDLAQVVADSVASMRTAGRLEGHELSLSTEPAWIEGDEIRLEQVLANLLGNAVKYTPPGGRIAVAVAREGDEAVLRVFDQGVGMDAGLVQKVFDLFVQGEQPLDRSAGGLGIGLTLVRRLVELHGGTVQAHSEGAGKGSVFTVRFKASRA